jgi:cullin 1
VTILTTSYWPIYKSFDLTIPKEIGSFTGAFNTYYQTKYNHRQLQWCYSLGSSTVYARYAEKNYNFVLSTYQMCIVMLFNTHQTLTFKQIKELMKFDDETASKNLITLMRKGYKVLSIE